MENGRRCNGAVLIVDDNPDVREVFAEILAMSGIPAVCAGNGVEVLAYLHSNPLPFLILLDLNMPVMDGWEFRKQLAQEPTLEAVPVVVVSAIADLDCTADAVDAPYHLPKPVDMHRPFSLVQSSQPRSQAAA